MKKYFKDLNQEEIRKVLEKNELLFDELSQHIYEDKMYCQEKEADHMFGEKWGSYIYFGDHYSSFYLRIKDWKEFINNLDKDYLTQEGIDLYNYIQDKKEIFNNMELYSENYYNLDDHLYKKSQELLEICENILHDYERYPDFDECYDYIVNNLDLYEDCYIKIDKKGKTDHILYKDISYTKSYE